MVRAEKTSVAIGYLGFASLGVWLRYHLVLSKASAEISRSIAGGAVEPGLQDAITPPLLAASYYLCFIAAVAAYFLQTSRFGVGHGPEGLLLLQLSAACAGRLSFPTPHRPYWVRLMHRSLLSRTDRHARRGNEARADTMRILAARLAQTFADTLQPAEPRVPTK
jgi:hypothetical protein